MTKKFDISRYKEVLELEPWEKWEKDFTDDIFKEFLGYQASIESQVSYNRKEEYFWLIHSYLIGTLSPCQFRSKFLDMEEEDWEAASKISQDFEALENFFLADDLEIFSDLIIEISTLCVDCNLILDESGERMPEIEFYSLVNSRYLQIQKVFPAISSKKLPYQKLISRSFQFLAGILLSEILTASFYISTGN